MRATLPLYRCHKHVRAGRIEAIYVGVGTIEGGDRIQITVDGAAQFRDVPAGWVDEKKAVPGGYYVEYSDSYASFSPAKAFEDGYIPASAPTAVLDPGHRYLIAGGQVLQFRKKELQGDEFVTTAEGTTNEGLLQVIIDRSKELNARFPCRENALAITKMEEALHWFEARTRDRQRRQVEGTAQA